MNRRNCRTLAERVNRAAEAALSAKQHVSAIEALTGIGWVDLGAEKRWRGGQIEYLEDVVQVDLRRISEAMMLFRSWASGKGLLAREMPYVARTPEHHTSRFSRSDDPTVERLYRTHWISSTLSERKRERVFETASRAPELVVIQPLNRKWTCHRCGGSGDLLIMENAGPACLRYVGLDDLEFLPAGDALLTRRVRERSLRYTVVVRFSRSRRRYERQGLLVESSALAAAEREIEEQRLR